MLSLSCVYSILFEILFVLPYCELDEDSNVIIKEQKRCLQWYKLVTVYFYLYFLMTFMLTQLVFSFDNRDTFFLTHFPLVGF